MCILHKLQSVLTGTTMRGSLSMLSKGSCWLTTSSAKLFLQKEKKLHTPLNRHVIFTTYILYKHNWSKERKKAVLDRWTMPAFWIQGNKKMDCWTNRLNCLNAPIYKGKKSTGKGVVKEGVEHFQQVKWELKRLKESHTLINCQSTAWEVIPSAFACLNQFGNAERIVVLK